VLSQKPPDPPCRQRALLPSHPQLFAGGPQVKPPPAELWATHEFLQPPQFASLPLTFVSHPLSAAGAAGMLQLPKPRLQLELQVPAQQERDITFVALQARPQPPQWLTLPDRLISQPFWRFPSQSPNSGLQVMPHRPAVHVAVPLVELQIEPQSLQ
jgi:hypothetical protein